MGKPVGLSYKSNELLKVCPWQLTLIIGKGNEWMGHIVSPMDLPTAQYIINIT